MFSRILFFGTDGPYGCFSNFYTVTIETPDGIFPSTEHYFHYRKFRDTDSSYAHQIKIAPTALDAKKLGSSRNHPLDLQWDNGLKIEVMKIALNAKFNADPHFRKTLMETANAILVENSPYDYYWGCGKRGTGKNVLGHLLVELRTQKAREYWVPQSS